MYSAKINSRNVVPWGALVSDVIITGIVFVIGLRNCLSFKFTA